MFDAARVFVLWRLSHVHSDTRLHLHSDDLNTLAAQDIMQCNPIEDIQNYLRKLRF